MYTINSILLYEYAWCVGVVSVTTDKCHLMSEHNNNYLHEVSNGSLVSGHHLHTLIGLPFSSPQLLVYPPLFTLCFMCHVSTAQEAHAHF